jgi:hypothetical protein
LIEASNKKGGIKNKFGFLSSNFMKLCRDIHRSVWQLLGGLNKFKMAAIAMVTKVQKMLNSLHTADPFAQEQDLLNLETKFCQI